MEMVRDYLPQGHPQVGLVSERKRRGTNMIKVSNRVMKSGKSAGKGSRSGGREEAVLQQEGVVSIEIHDDL